MNSYERFKEIRRLKEKAIRNNRVFSRLTHDHKIMCAFETAFLAVYGKWPKVTKKLGWYTVVTNETKNYREKDLVQLTRELEAKIHERSLISENSL